MKERRDRLAVVLALLVAVAMLVSGCTPAAPQAESPKTGGTKTEAPRAEAPKTEAPKAEAPKVEAPKAEAPKAEAPKAAPAKPVRVALAAPISGPFAPAGKTVHVAVQIAVEDFNKGAQVPVEFIFEDAGSTNTSAQNAINKVLEAKPAAVFNGVMSNQFGSTMPVLAQEKVPTVVISTAPSIYEQGWTWVFGTLPTASVEPVVALKYLKEKLGKTKVAAFLTNEDVGKSVSEILDATAKAQGGTVYPAFFQIGDNDFSGNIAAARRNNPDSYVLYGPGMDLAKIVRQMKQSGVQEPIFVHLVASPMFLRLLEPSETDGLYGWTASLPDLSTDPKVQAFAKIYKERANQDADMGATHAYDGATMLFSAAAKANGDRQKTIENMRAIKGYKGLSGEFNYDAKGRGRFETNLVRIGADKKVEILGVLKVDPK